MTDQPQPTPLNHAYANTDDLEHMTWRAQVQAQAGHKAQVAPNDQSTLPHLTPPQRIHIDPNLALQALIHAQGNPALAAERLGLLSADPLLAAIAQSKDAQDEMRHVMRGFMMVRLLGVAQNLEDELLARTQEMTAAELARLYTAMLQMTEVVTRPQPAPPPTDNPHEALLKLLPPDIVRAFQTVMSHDMAGKVLPPAVNSLSTGTNGTSGTHGPAT